MFSDIENVILPVRCIIVIRRIIERFKSDTGHAVRNSNARQLIATVECKISDTCNTVRNGNARQAATIIERITSDTRRIVRNRKIRHQLII